MFWDKIKVDGALAKMQMPKSSGLLRFVHSKKAWEGIVADAKLENFRFKDLRHTFASWLVQGGVDLYVVKDLLCHSSIKTTEVYAHLAPDQKAAAVDRVFGSTLKSPSDDKSGGDGGLTPATP